jgi:hypothetical protein
VVTPSPHSHDTFVGLLVDVLVSLIPAGHKIVLFVAGVNIANGGSGGAVVVMYSVVLLDALALVTVSVIGTVPTSVNSNDGFCSDDVLPAILPNTQLHDRMSVTDISVNPTDSGVYPLVTLVVKFTIGGILGSTVMVVDDEVSDPDAFVTLRNALNVPTVSYVNTGFCTSEKFPFPNVQFHAVMSVADVSVNATVNGVMPLVVLVVKLASGIGIGADTLNHE